MKTNNLKAAAAMGLTALLLGSAAAQESMSKPVGYETISIEDGFNYIGLRLHEAPVASGTIETVNADSLVDDQADFTTLAAGTYILEINNGTGIVQEITSFTNGTTVPTDDLTADVVAGAEYTIRPIATVASVFGAANESGLNEGNVGLGTGDQVWIPGDAGFDKYYYDASFNFGAASWVQLDESGNGTAVPDPSSINLFYTDGIVVVGAGGQNDLVVTGSVKLSQTSYMIGEGFNYLSTVAPAGADLSTLFGADNQAGLDEGNVGLGTGDQVWIPADVGFDKYYYDASFNFGDASWVQLDENGAGTAVPDASAVSLEDASGFIVVNGGAAQMTTGGVPSFYTDGTL